MASRHLQHPLLEDADLALASASSSSSSLSAEVDETVVLDRRDRCCLTLRRFRQSPLSVVVVVSFAMFVDLLVYAIIIPVLPLFVQRRFHSGSSAIGLLFACYAAGLLVFTPIFALISDRGDTRRWPMLLGLICLAASTVLFGISTEMWQLALARVAQGASAAATNTVGLAMVADIFPPSELATQMGVVMAINGLGGFVGPPLGGALYDHVSFVAIFLVVGGCALADLLLRVVLIDDAWMRRKREQLRVIQAELDLAAQASTEVPSASPPPLEHIDTVAAINQDGHAAVMTDYAYDALLAPPVVPVVRPKLSILDMLRIPSLMVSQVSVLVFAVVFTGIEPLLSPHFSHTFHSSSSAIGYSYFAIAVPYMLSSIGAGALVEAGWNKKLLVSAGFVAMSLSLAVFAWPRSIWLELLPMVAFGSSVGVAITPPLSEIADYLAKTGNHASFAQGYALFNLSFSGGMFLGPIISGVLYEHTSFFWTMMVLVGAAAATALLLLVFGMKEGREAREDQRRREELKLLGEDASHATRGAHTEP